MRRGRILALALLLATIAGSGAAQPNAPSANERIEQKGTAPAAGALVDETRPAAPAASGSSPGGHPDETRATTQPPPAPARADDAASAASEAEAPAAKLPANPSRARGTP